LRQRGFTATTYLMMMIT